MYTKKINLPLTWYSLFSTCIYIGKLPASGTLASVLTYPIFYYITISCRSFFCIQFYLLLSICLLFIIGILAIHKLQIITNSSDHKYIVIDEVIGQLVTLFFSSNYLSYIIKITSINIPNNIASFGLSLIIFRYFDIQKPLIISYINNHYKGSFGVILDDIISGLLASFTIYITYLLVSLFISY